MATSKAGERSKDAQKRSIVFFHPDLGIGGAERLIIDAAVGLQELGHKVTIFTSHCDPQHCFEEARDGTLDVRVRGNTIFPPTILNRFHILLAVLRQIHLVLSISFFSSELRDLRPNVFIVDQLSACVPILREFYPKKQRILFYCHFPDQLLADRKESGILGVVKKIYRYPFDWFEGWSMGASDKIVVNSNFTKSVASKIFPALSEDFGVTYPCVGDKSRESLDKDGLLWDGKFKILLSINRFERKKDVGLGIRAYTGLSSEERQGTRLILAGGYDNRVKENVEYHEELVQLAEQSGLVTATAKTVPSALGVPDNVDVLFLLSVPGAFKETLLRSATVLLYTPQNEHFGIVPVEAMQSGLPVLASNTGGPLETVIDGETGWLRDANEPAQWTEIIKKCLSASDVAQLKSMGSAGENRVRENFTRTTMAHKFDEDISSMLKNRRSTFDGGKEVGMALGIMVAFTAALLATLLRQYLSGDGNKSVTKFATARRAETTSPNKLKLMPLRGAI